MKRLLAILLLLSLVLVCGCALQDDQSLDLIENDEYRLQAVNDTGDSIRGFGYEWYRDDELILTGQCTAHDGGFLEPDDLISETLKLTELGGEGHYALRIYVLDRNSADYCEQTFEIDLTGGMLIRLIISGSKGAYCAKITS
ncbi:MAG: hypothetical protein MJ085_01440 [Clostridia bacterium]|nr:hypothetical protein [Clostridia bacterium]